MFLGHELHSRLAQDRIERELEIALLLRRARKPSVPIRQAIGRRIIQIGARLAAEPSFESVRSR